MSFPYDANSGFALNNFQMYSSINYVDRFEPSFPITRLLCLLTAFTQCSLAPTAGNHKSGLSFWVCLLLKPSPRVASWRWLVRNTATQHLRASQHGRCISTHDVLWPLSPDAQLALWPVVLWLEVCASVSLACFPPPPTPSPPAPRVHPLNLRLFLSGFARLFPFFGSHILEKSYSICPSLTFHFSVLPSRSIPVAAGGGTSSLFTAKQCLAVHTCLVSFIHADLDGHASGSHALVTIKLLWTQGASISY